jgi:hypothetical protein
MNWARKQAPLREAPLHIARSSNATAAAGEAGGIFRLPVGAALGPSGTRKAKAATQPAPLAP